MDGGISDSRRFSMYSTSSYELNYESINCVVPQKTTNTHVIHCHNSSPPPSLPKRTLQTIVSPPPRCSSLLKHKFDCGNSTHPSAINYEAIVDTPSKVISKPLINMGMFSHLYIAMFQSMYQNIYLTCIQCYKI